MGQQVITLGGGCFWCLEAVYEMVEGVTAVENGYSNGHVDKPTYEQVCSGNSGHVEVVKVSFDDERISLREVLEIFFSIHDPTTMNRQGNDVGSQYRSGIYWQDPAQQPQVDRLLGAPHQFTKPAGALQVVQRLDEGHLQGHESLPGGDSGMAIAGQTRLGGGRVVAGRTGLHRQPSRSRKGELRARGPGGEVTVQQGNPSFGFLLRVGQAHDAVDLGPRMPKLAQGPGIAEALAQALRCGVIDVGHCGHEFGLDLRQLAQGQGLLRCRCQQPEKQALPG